MVFSSFSLYFYLRLVLRLQEMLPHQPFLLAIFTHSFITEESADEFNDMLFVSNTCNPDVPYISCEDRMWTTIQRSALCFKACPVQVRIKIKNQKKKKRKENPFRMGSRLRRCKKSSGYSLPYRVEIYCIPIEIIAVIIASASKTHLLGEENSLQNHVI